MPILLHALHELEGYLIECESNNCLYWGAKRGVLGSFEAGRVLQRKARSRGGAFSLLISCHSKTGGLLYLEARRSADQSQSAPSLKTPRNSLIKQCVKGNCNYLLS